MYKQMFFTNHSGGIMTFSKTFFVCILAAALYVPASAQIPNAGFENWTGGEPDGWVSSNINGIVTNVTQSAVAHSGSSAVRGAVVQFFTSLLGPVIQVGPEAQGFGYNQRPVSVTGYYQFSPQGGDRFGVNVVLFHGGINGTAVGTAALAISQGTSSYIQFNAPFVYHTNDIPDTCVLQFQIVGPVTGPDYHLGSYFLLDDLAFAGISEVSGQEGAEPSLFQLSQNYPNPFNPSTTINFSVPSGRDLVREADGQFSTVNRQLTILKVYDVLGREVTTLLNEERPAGAYTIRWDASGVSSGVYFYRLTAGSFVQTKRMLLLR
jgi:hypothetical protein